MQTSDRGIALLKQLEGCRLHAYLDGARVWTIGYGDIDNVHAGMTITQEEAENRLRSRLGYFEQGVSACLSRQPEQSQFDAMVLLAYNIGLGWTGDKKPSGARDGFRQSTVLKAFNSGDSVAAAAAFSLWTKITDPATGKKVDNAGLMRRRALEKALFLEDAPQARLQPPPAEAPTLSESGTIQGAKVAGSLLVLAQAKNLVDQFQDTLMNLPWLGTLFQTVVAYSPKIAILLGLGALVAVGYMVWRRMDDRNSGKV